METSRPIMLIHGFASSFAMNWTRNGWVDLLKDIGRQTLAVDLLGHGTAPKPHDPMAYSQLESRVLDALPDEGVIDAIGFSLGAMTLVRAINAAPERFGRIILAGIGEGNLVSRDSEAVARMIENAGNSDGGDPVSTDEVSPDDAASSRVGRAFAVFATSEGNDPRALAACQRASRPTLTLEDFRVIKQETLFVVGDRDFVGSADPLAAVMANAHVKTLRGVDHFGTPQNFGFLDAALEYFAA